MVFLSLANSNKTVSPIPKPVPDKELPPITSTRSAYLPPPHNALTISPVESKISNTKLNGPDPGGDKRLCNNINISFNNIEGEAIGGYLDAYGICSSTGSACSSHTLEPSHVLKAIGLSDLQANTSLRLSLSKFNTNEEIDYVLEVLNKVVGKLRGMSPIK